MVREVLADSDLDPVVRSLSIERLEATLLERARARLGAHRDLSVHLADDGTVAVFESSAPLEDAALSAHLDLALVATLAPTIGAARVDVKHGHRPTKKRTAAPADAPLAAAEATTSWVDVARRLTALLRLQSARIAELEAALGAKSAHPEVDRALNDIEAALRPTRDR